MQLLSSQRFVCVHGHFYQPPRRNPFTGLIPYEAGAEPYPNYNAKINAECYRPNAALGNFRWLSFDVGPTLTDWLADHDPLTLRRIVAADRWAARHHGAAPGMAQSYHHTILPLASPRDRTTEILWGVRDFQYRFSRFPLGLWLPETAVDLATLDALAAAGIVYTVLAPWQVAPGVVVEPGQPYLIRLPSGRSLTVFFYDAELSGLISFHPEATVEAPRFVAEQLLQRYHVGQTAPQLVLIASDGELYGHHQPYRDLFLQDLFHHRLTPAGLRPTTLEGYLHRWPERRTASLQERTSWSCHHGVERWYTSCDCSQGRGIWKQGLRGVFDRLSQTLDGLTDEALAPLLVDVWAARDDYIEVLLGTLGATGWLARHARHTLDSVERQRVLDLMAAQQQRLAMYASCAFYWEDLDRIEPRNAAASAIKAARLADQTLGGRLAADVLSWLDTVTSPLTGRSAAAIVQPLLESAEAAG